MLKFHITPELREQVIAHLAGDAKLANWFLQEMQVRAERELAEALRDQAVVSVENFKAQHRPVDGLGQCTFRIAKKLADWIHTWIGPQWVYDEAFIQQLVKDNQDLCFRPSVEKKASIIVPEKWAPSNQGAAA